MKNTLILLTLVFCLKITAQNNPFQRIGNDLPFPALDACFDKNNKLYAICASPDSLFAYSLNNTSNKWIKEAKIKFENFVYEKYANQNAKCFFIDTVLFVNITDGSDSTRIFKINNNNTFTKVGVLYKANSQPWNIITIHSIAASRDFVVFTGNFSHVSGGLLVDGIVKFNGTSFTKLNIEWEPNPNIFTRNDTLFYERMDTIFSYNLITNIKSLYYKSNSTVLGLTGNAGSLFYYDFTGNVYEIKKNTLIEKTNRFSFEYSGANKCNLFYLNNNFILCKPTAGFKRDIFIKNGNTFKGLQTPNYAKDFHISNIENVKIISDQNSNLYMVSGAEREFNGIYYNIVKFKLDSLSTFGYDSIYLRTFGDKDNNGKFNAGDEIHTSILGNYIINNETPFADLYGSDYHKFILPDYRNYKFSAIWDMFNPSCYEMPISGSYTTDNLLPGITLDTLEFAMRLKSSVTDKQIKFITSSRARLNDTIMNIVRVQDFGCNQGNSTAFAKVVLKPKTIFISGGYNFLNKKGDTLIFKIDSINSQSVKTFSFNTKYTNTDFKIDDIAVHHVILTQSQNNNQTIYGKDSIGVKMVYSYDPNIKEAIPTGSVYTNANKFRYTIHFQNEGNDDARDVTVVDNLDNRFITSSIKMIESSHPYSFSIFKNKLTWEFKNINLKPKNVSEPLSSGYLIFEIEKNEVLNLGDSIRNNAEIYFDLNEPIITNFATLRIVEKPKDTDTSTVKILNRGFSNNEISIYPNPSNGKFTITVKQLMSNSNYEVLNTLGQTLEKKWITNDVHQITIKEKGIYFVKITLADNVLIHKIIVE